MAINPKTNKRIINPVVSPGINRETLLNKIKLKIQERVSSNVQNSQYGEFGDFSSLDRSVVNTSNYRDLPSVTPREGIIGTPYDPATERYSTIPEGYKSKISGGTLSPLARFSNIPEAMGYGQYVNDPSQPNTLFKSSREENVRWDNAMLLGGLPNDTFQVEHIIPLWAGGSDTMNNKTIMSVKDHEQKTKAQAVAMTLLYAGKIDKSSALAMAMNWKDKDVKGIEIDQNTGMIKGDGLKIAEDKVAEWNTPKGVTFKDWVNETPESVEKILETISSISETTSSKIMPASLYDFGKSVLTGLTLGWYKPGETDYSKWSQPWDSNKQDPRTDVEKAVKPYSDFVGTTAGNIVAYTVLGKLIGVAGGLTNKIPRVGNTNANPLNWSSSVSTALSKSLPKLADGKITVSAEKAARVLDSMGLFAIGGQLSRQDEEAIGGRGGRLIKDLVMGALFGSAGQNWKSLKPLQNDYIKIGAGTFTLSYLEGANAKDSLINSATMMAMHGMGYRGNKELEAMTKSRVEQMANEAAIKQRSKILGSESTIPPRPGESNKKYTIERISEENAKIANILENKVKTGELSFGEAQAEMEKTIISSRQLYRGGLGKEASLREELADLTSMAKRTRENKNDLIQEKPGIARTFVNYVNENPDILDAFIAPRVKPIDISEFKGEIPTGKIQITGVANDISPNNAANIRSLAPLVSSGRVDDRVYFVYRPDYEGIINGVNKKITKAEITAGTQKKYDNPKNNWEVVKIVNGEPISLGMVPRPWKIEGAKFSQNNSIRSANAKYGTDHQLLDVNLNKNTITNAAIKNGVNVLEGRIIDIRPEALISKEPVLVTELTSDGWLHSVAKNRGLKTLDQIQTDKVIASWKEMKKTESPTKQLSELPLPEEGSVVVKTIQKEVSPMLSAFENAKTPKEYVDVVDKYFGEGVTTEPKISELLKKSENPTYKEIQQTFDPEKITKEAIIDGINGLNDFGGDLYKHSWDAIINTPLTPKKKVIKTEIKKQDPNNNKVVVNQKTEKIPTQQNIIEAMKKVSEPTIVDDSAKSLKGGRVVTRKMTPEEIALVKERNNTYSKLPDQEVPKRPLSESDIKEEINRSNYEESRLDKTETENTRLIAASEAKMDNRAAKLTTKSLSQKLSESELKELDRISTYFEQKYNNPYSPIIINKGGKRSAISRLEAKSMIAKLELSNKPENKKLINALNDKLYGETGSTNTPLIPFEPILTKENLSTPGIKSSKSKAFWNKFRSGLNLDMKEQNPGGILDKIIESKTKKSEQLTAKNILRIMTGREYSLTDKEVELTGLVQMGKINQLPSDIANKINQLKKNNPQIRIYAAPGEYKNINNVLNNKNVKSFNMFPYIRESVKAPEVFSVLSSKGITKNKLSQSEILEIGEFLRSGDKDYLKSSKIRPILIDYYESKKGLSSNVNKGQLLKEMNNIGMEIKTSSDFAENQYTILDIYNSIVSRSDSGIRDAENAAENLVAAIKAIHNISSKYKN